MTFMIILLVVFIVATVLSLSQGDSESVLLAGIISGIIACALAISIPILAVDTKENKALMQAHLENPANYTYSQLAEHNELVTKAKVWQGTIFSFYNDVDLQTIDIDSVSQKVVIDSKEK